MLVADDPDGCVEEMTDDGGGEVDTRKADHRPKRTFERGDIYIFRFSYIISPVALGSRGCRRGHGERLSGESSRNGGVGDVSW